jgi:hypothetical protein
MSTADDETTSGPLELLESARSKYQLALARLRRAPTELALLSLHGAIEDVLRAHGLRLDLPAAYQPFPQLLEALTTARQLPLSGAEAEGVRRMHRLRALVAHGEQIVVTRETVDAYQRLAARLLTRYGVLVVSPESASEVAEPPRAGEVRRGDTMTMLRAETEALPRRGETARMERELAPTQPRRERTVYPDGGSTRYPGRVRPSKATSDLPLAQEWANAARRADRAGQLPWQADGWAQRWLLPGVAILTIFLIGAVISVSLQQMRASDAVPTAAVPTVLAPVTIPQITTTGPISSSIDSVVPTSGAPTPATTAAPTDASGLAPGRAAIVRADTLGLNVRAQPGVAPDNPVIFSLAPGSQVEIIGGPVTSDGFEWWEVRGPIGEGWSAGEYLEVR